MRALVIQFTADSGPGRVGEGMVSCGMALDVRDGSKLLDGDLSDLGYGGLLLLGGPQSAADTVLPTSLSQSMQLARSFHAAGKPVLGICLGGQLLARAFGGKVYVGHRGEFGFCRLQFATPPDRLFAVDFEGLSLMQWHDDSFAPPPGARRIVMSDACRDQGFRLEKTVGLQFHPEVDENILGAWLKLRASEKGDPKGAAVVRGQAAASLPRAMEFGFELGRRFSREITAFS